MSDPRPPDDGPSWPERDLDERRPEEPAEGWSDDPYRYEPPPPFKRSYEQGGEGEAASSNPRYPAGHPFADENPFPDYPPPRADETWKQLPDEQRFDEPARIEEPWQRPAEEETFEEPRQPDPWQRPPEEQTFEEPRQPDPWQRHAEETFEETHQPDPWQRPPDERAFDEQRQPEPWERSAEEQRFDEPPAEEPRLEEQRQPEFWQRPAEEQRFEEAPAEEAPAEDARAEEARGEEQRFEEQPAPVEQPADEQPADEQPTDEPPEPEPPSAEPDTQAAEPVTAFAGGRNAWDPKLHGNRRRPTTAEQAVPWMIGIILALTGMVIVLLALIFSSPNGLVAGEPSSTPLPSTSADPPTKPSTAPSEGPASPSAEPSASTEPTPGPSPTPAPTWGPLEMVYLGRPTTTAPIYVLRRDFSEDVDPRILAQADQGVTNFAWSPDGTVGAAIISGRAVALTPGDDPRRLAEDVSALTFGWDAETVYAVRIARDGANDRAQVLEIDFVSRASEVIATIRYPRPLIGSESPLREAQFIDDGGVVRIYAVADGNLAVWILGAPSTYRVDPGNGEVTDIAREPVLWSPDGSQRVTLQESGGNTTLRLRNRSGEATASVTVNGLVSHVRWAGTSNEIVFTLGRISANGGVRQDLYVWDLRDGRDPAPLTSNGASFGADWRGVMANWAP